MFFSESGILHQLVNLFNNTHDYYPEILAKIDDNIMSTLVFFKYCNIYLNTYIFECYLRFYDERGRSVFSTNMLFYIILSVSILIDL